jgi:hypothetical protein
MRVMRRTITTWSMFTRARERSSPWAPALGPVCRAEKHGFDAEDPVQSLVMARSPLALAPDIEDFRRQFEQIAADADALVGPLRDDQFTWHPAPGAWSIAECLDHLNATARMYLPVLDTAIAEAVRKGKYGQGPFTYMWIGRLIVHLSEPPPRIRFRAAHDLQPIAGRPRRAIMAAVRAYQVQYVDRLRQANGLDLARVWVASPFTKWLRFSLGSGFALMAAHERRHLWQVRQIMAMPEFPR